MQQRDACSGNHKNDNLLRAFMRYTSSLLNKLAWLVFSPFFPEAKNAKKKMIPIPVRRNRSNQDNPYQSYPR